MNPEERLAAIVGALEAGGLSCLVMGGHAVRHYGLLANRTKHDKLAQCRALLHVEAPAPTPKKTTAEWILLLLGIDVTCCPRCGAAALQRTELPPVRSVATAQRPPPAREDTS